MTKICAKNNTGITKNNLSMCKICYLTGVEYK